MFLDKFKLKNFLALFFFSCGILNGQSIKEINSIFDKIENNEYNQAVKKEMLDDAFKLTHEINNDSLRNSYYLKLSILFKKNSDSLRFRETINKSLFLSKKLKDSNSLARCFWRLGDFLKTTKSDSSYHFYHNAKEIFILQKKDIQAARMLVNMAIIQKNVKDYTGSEVNTTEAIKIFRAYNENNGLYKCYNNLGIIFKNIENYEKSLEYHNDALDFIKKIEKNEQSKTYSLNNLKAYTLNNIGLVYRYQGKYEEAINNFKEALSFDKLRQQNPRHYATLLDNLAYSKFLSNHTDELSKLFYEALKIRDSLKDNSGISVSKIHLAEYYLAKKDTLQSLKHVKDARIAAVESNNMKQLLNSLLLLSKVDNEKSTSYLEKYIRMNDSLVKHERTTRNKFARIKFETDVVKTRNERLSIQNTWIVAISTAIIFFGFLIYIITQQRTRNKELEMEQQQQRANEEIYNLMIDQQDKIEEGRKREKERISLELHDGILGRLFGTRLSLGSLNAKDDNDSKKVRQQYINELQSIEEEVRNISHELGLDNFDKSTSYSTMITNLLEEQSKITNFKYQIEDDDRIIWTDIPGHIKINIYRIIQESIQNINKYAQAENVILDFKKNDNRIILTIKDDGVGFDQDKRSSGIGLKNMKSRVTLLHGQFTINSIPGKGTSISVDVPMT
ncbi:tetratricopeptide repeat protein [Kordia sp. TARA_039_SRF]|nr:tetratricopeptide repeat protein [Kordia sp. TARA_039_SRF]